MKFLQAAVAIVVLVSGLGAARAQEGSGFSDLPNPCGDHAVAIAQMQWPSAAVLAHIHAILVARQLGCETRVVAGDLTATTSSIVTTGQPAVVPEMWPGRVAEIWNSALETQSMRQAAPTFSGGTMEGWFVPDFVLQNHPELTSAQVLKDYVSVFAVGGDRPKFVSCPSDWACAVINRGMLQALGLASRFEIVEPANRFELDGLIGEAMSRREPILFYYWQPNPVLGQFTFTQLDLGPYNPDAMHCLARRSCITSTMSSFAPEPVVIALAEWVFTDAPQLAGYFQRATMPLVEMNALLAWQNEQGETAEAAARRFVDTRGEVWRPWFGL